MTWRGLAALTLHTLTDLLDTALRRLRGAP